jgi:hypothetical protein
LLNNSNYFREIVQNWYDGIREKLFYAEKRIENNEESIPNWQERIIITPDRKLSGYVTYTAQEKSSNKLLGYIEYDPIQERLSFANFGVKLSRKILLLGYSSKRDKRLLVGQFGEGLKIGILSIVRERHQAQQIKRTVIMKTSNERWSFDLLHDDEFQEDVLGVNITKESHRTEQSISKKDQDEEVTMTIIERVTREEWSAFEKDYLFLNQPTEFCDTQTGTLLLEEQHRVSSLYYSPS